jgi:hypothetical protein
MFMKDGVEVPASNGAPVGHDEISLLCNEYIAYDATQVHISCLLKIKFIYDSCIHTWLCISKTCF